MSKFLISVIHDGSGPPFLWKISTYLSQNVKGVVLFSYTILEQKSSFFSFVWSVDTGPGNSNFSWPGENGSVVTCKGFLTIIKYYSSPAFIQPKTFSTFKLFSLTWNGEPGF